MKKKTPASKIGASLLVTLAVIMLSYLLLPQVTSIGAANGPAQSPQRKSAAAAAKAVEKQARLALGALPLSFEMNRGQFDPQVQFVSRGTGYKAFLTQSETVFVLRKPGTTSAATNSLEKIRGATRAARAAEIARLKQAQAAERAASKAVVRMSLVGGNSNARMAGMEEMPGKINYFRGKDEQKWVKDVPTYRRVVQAGVYPGIDLVYYTNGSELEYDLVVAPGADPNQIALEFDGAERIEVDATTGGLVIHAAGGAQLRQGKPFLYQELNGLKQPVPGAFIAAGNRAGFSVGQYDRNRPLVIDPAIISYSTYLGGEGNDRAHAIAADADGNAYVVGWTQSELFPVKDAYQAGQNADSDEAFITKFNPDGSQLIWSTYLGGGQGVFTDEGPTDPSEGAYGVALDADRNVYVTGYTFSSDFPVRNAMQPNLSDAGCCFLGDSFIAKLNAAGNQLVFSTYFGGADGDDFGRGIAVDRNNHVYVTGYTNSFAFPTTNPIQGEIDGRTEHFNNFEQSFDGYLAKIDASGQFRVYSTYIGGPQNDLALGVAVDANGVAYVTGWTESTQPVPEVSPSPSPSPTPPDASPTPTPEPTPLERFPITENAFQPNPGGGGQTRDAFVTKVAADGVEFIYSTFLGGDGTDEAWGIAVGADRGTYVTGYTDSGAPIGGAGPVPFQNEFPTTEHAFQPDNAGGFDAFLTRFSPVGSELVYSTYLGGQFDEGPGGDECGFGCGFRYDGGAVAVDILGNAYITGWTESTFVPFPDDRPNGADGAPPIGNFPTKDAFQPDPGSNPGSSGPESRDAFVAMFNTNVEGDPPSEDTLVYSSFLGGSSQDEGQGISLDPGGNVFIAGWTRSECGCESVTGPAPVGDNDFPTTEGAFQEEPSFADDGWVVALVGSTTGTEGQGLGFMIFGQVLTDEGDPLPGVTITLTRPDGTTEETTTDANGTYSFPNLPPVPENPYTVTPSGGGFSYQPSSREIVITNKNERADFEATLNPSPTPTPTPEGPIPSPTSTPTPTPSPGSTPTPTPTPASQALNLSTRLHVLTGDQVGIGGFIITGGAPKHVIIRAIGPSLTRFGIPNPLPDPVLELHGPGSFVTITNNNWRDTQEEEIKASGIPPTDNLESAIDITLAPGNYTGIIRGNGGTTGIGLIEVYDLDSSAASKLSNISTRGFVGSTPGDSIIAGFILGNGDGADRIVIRGLGPSLASSGVPNTLQNPTLELHDGDGALLYTNNDWQDDPDNAAEVINANLAPSNDLEAAIAATLPPGVYTAILAGLQNTTGNGLIEIYDRGAGP
ncbi:MAG TPA: SBBP repeat-containing protein [Chthoniobacterales bacterium]|nr:SBBP repeat-containing protein [Chthoniobacterales bacterium]